ncbi:hypothetical protein DM02DRAFT_654329 [Periconia macrospinosa]|uniref:Secreted protein n=1 Tax=Periconia macrospinosa TaxID=97972 RepID=A0A2V1DXL1_9PLEO|nr:hypothetical protein DM02DRAFT_654329 [Periconia macrospinosa]
MKGSYAIVLTFLLGQGVLAANPKLNQYASIDDCKNDRNIISHASPSLWSCHKVDGRTQAVYLVVGDGDAGQYYFTGCDEHNTRNRLATGQCITLPAGTTEIGKWV